MLKTQANKTLDLYTGCIYILCYMFPRPSFALRTLRRGRKLLTKLMGASFHFRADVWNYYPLNTVTRAKF